LSAELANREKAYVMYSKIPKNKTACNWEAAGENHSITVGAFLPS
jgi:hypothetical protein